MKLPASLLSSKNFKDTFLAEVLLELEDEEEEEVLLLLPLLLLSATLALSLLEEPDARAVPAPAGLLRTGPGPVRLA